MIKDIAHRYVIEEANKPPILPASFAPETLYLSLSLSNMHGIDYAVPYFESDGNRDRQFISTFFSDMARFVIEKGNLPNEEKWKQISEAAIASGNFPFAFNPHQILRMGSNYPGSIHEHDPDLFKPPGLSFIDGGLFNNEPLREAIDLSRKADGGTLDSNRIFILIDPSVNTSLHLPAVDPDGNLASYAQRVFTMIRGESTARDWLRAQRINNEIQWRDQLVQDLADMLKSSSLTDGQQINDELSDLAKRCVATKRELFGTEAYPENYMTQTIERTFQQVPLGDALEKVSSDGQAALKQEIFKKLVFVLNNVAGLQNKSEIRLALIGSDQKETAGDQLYAFEGFFEKDWRIYDFRLGREKAHAILDDILGQAYPKETLETGELHEDYRIPDAWREKFPHVTIQDANLKLRKNLRDVVIERINIVLKEEAKIGRFYRWAIRKFILKKLLNRELGI